MPKFDSDLEFCQCLLLGIVDRRAVRQIRRDGDKRLNDWLHEVKFDGFRVQLHIVGGVGTLFSRNGHDLTQRFAALRPVLSEVAANNAIIDAELVSCGKDGQPDFVDLMKRAGKADRCLWAFDLLSFNCGVLLDKPLLERRRRLNDVINRTDDERIFMAAAFDNPIRLLEV